MIYVSDFQRETLLLVDELINKKMTFEEITNYLYDKGYHYCVETKNGYTSKTHFKIYRNVDGLKNEYSFVDLIKRRNGFAYWETYRLS